MKNLNFYRLINFLLGFIPKKQRKKITKCIKSKKSIKKEKKD